MLNNNAYKALAHPIRRDILKRLQQGPLSAGELAKAYNISKPSLSTHFAVLKQSRLIQPERDGNHIYYRLNTAVADEVLAGIMDLLGLGTSKITNENKGVIHD